MKRNHYRAVCSFLIWALPFVQGAGAYSEAIPVCDGPQDRNQQDGEALGILEERASELDLEKLTQYALRHGKASVAKRLGWALDLAGIPHHMTAPPA